MDTLSVVFLEAVPPRDRPAGVYFLVPVTDLFGFAF